MLHRRIMIAATAAATRNPAASAQKTRLAWMPVPNSTLFVVARMFSSSQNPSLSYQSNREQKMGDLGDPDRRQQEDQPRPPREPQHRRDRNPQINKEGTGRKESRSRSPDKKWRAPFWLPPSSSRRRRNPHHEHQHQHQHPKQKHRGKPRRFRNERLPCRQHLDPDGSMGFPTSDWVQIFGALPMTSLEGILDSIEGILRRELLEPTRTNQRHGGVVDLDAEWNPVEDHSGAPLVDEILDRVPCASEEQRPEFALDNDTDGDRDPVKNNDNGTNNSQVEAFRAIKAHVVLSPFGRPTGWNLKLASPSMVNALLSVANDARVRGSIRIGWRFAKVKEYHPRPVENDHNDTRTMLLVNDTMVRFENCPSDLTEDYLRHMLSRYELTAKGSTIIKWKGRTDDGKAPPLTYVVRFATAAYARAAVREMQGKLLKGQAIRLIQYPRQLL
mmetsp:Transcript_25210/g.69511  ORF Transcript_25210/g.69511 Transcript_25210/m.69511 type:complete len:444 (-) Transcript_25210:3807-5138(-)